MYNIALSRMHIILMFSTLILYYIVFVKKEKINYLFILVLITQAIADLFFVEKQIYLNYIVGLSLYFIVNLLLVIVLNTKVKENNVKQARLVVVIGFVLLALFAVFLVFVVKQLLPIIYALMMILLVYSAYQYYTLHTRFSSFLMLFGVSAYLVCAAAASLGVFMMFNFYYVSIQVVTYVIAMYCITSALINESENIYYNDVVG